MSFVEKTLISPFPVGIPFISFSRLIALAGTFSMMSKRSDEKGRPCLVPDRPGGASSFSSLSVVSVSCRFSVVVLYLTEKVPLYS